MIRIENIRIEKFRGIRDLALDLKGANFGICGPNGTGKSGVVDAIEFALTGDVSRLSGRGTGDLSVKGHAPHVKERGDPKQARVTLSAHIPSLGKSATITRSVDSPSAYTLEPDEPAIKDVIEQVQIHPEFALSRREIIRYILSEPNKRAADVQALLRLAEVEQTRKALTTVANDARKSRDVKEQTTIRARQDLLKTFGIEAPDTAVMLGIINASRAILALPALEKLEAGTSLKQGVPEAPKDGDAPVKKALASADIEKITTAAADGESEGSAAKRAAATGELNTLIDDAAALQSLKQQSLVKAGIDLVHDDHCPLCDVEWDREALLRHLGQKLESARQATELLSRLNADLNHVIGEMEAHAGLLQKVIATAARLDPSPDVQPLRLHKEKIDGAAAALRTFVAETSGLDDAKAALELEWWAASPDMEQSLTACADAVTKLPDVSDEDKARDFLTLAEEQYRKAVEARSEFTAAKERSQTAARVLEVYQDQSDAILETLYDEVAEDFTDYYRSLNQDDEGEFEGKLAPSAAKLGFNVDFYGYGKFPPGAYHSEGHQDGMGLCLYLALMKRTLGDKFTFSVLDDVLMSVDADHRREVCKLLKRDFPNTQFILTTHDRVWLKFMHTESLIENSQTFSGWTVETGPQVWHHREVWDEIEEALNKDDVQSAAALLRHYLEFMATILADSLQAAVQFRGDGQYSLGDLMPPVLSRWRKKIADAIKVANSWEKEDDKARLTELLARIDDARGRTQAEQWAINPAVHYNVWANFRPNEIRPVVQAFSDILSTMQCQTCKGYAELQPRYAQAETIRCNCGDLFINLKKKVA